MYMGLMVLSSYHAVEPVVHDDDGHGYGIFIYSLERCKLCILINVLLSCVV